jgi:DNA-binding MarR family transcriptional regulator
MEGPALSSRRERARLEGEVSTAMLRVFDKVQRSRRLTRDYGTGDRLTMVEAEVCQLIGATDGISPSDLADRIGVSRPAVSQALNRLRERDLITVDAAPDNGKARVVRVTATGATVARGVTDLHRQMARAVYAEAPDLEVILQLFERLDAFFADVMADGQMHGLDGAPRRRRS